MAKRKPSAGPSLFDDGPAESTALAVAKPFDNQQDVPEPPPFQILWGYIAATIGKTAAKANASRVGKLAKEILAAGISPEEYRASLPGLLRQFPAGRIVTIGFLAQHWPYLRGEGMTTGRNPLQDAVDAQADIEARNGSFTF